MEVSLLTLCILHIDLKMIVCKIRLESSHIHMIVWKRNKDLMATTLIITASPMCTNENKRMLNFTCSSVISGIVKYKFIDLG